MHAIVFFVGYYLEINCPWNNEGWKYHFRKCWESQGILATLSGLGYGAVRQFVFSSDFDDWKERILASKPQLAFNIVVPEPAACLQQAGALGVLLYLARTRRIRAQN